MAFCVEASIYSFAALFLSFCLLFFRTIATSSESCLLTHSLFQAPRKCLETHEKNDAKNAPSKRSRAAVWKKALRKPTCKPSARLIVRILSTYEACISLLHQGAVSYGSYESKREKSSCLTQSTIHDI